MWYHISNWLQLTEAYVLRMDSWDWAWVVAVAVLVGGWSLRTMPIGTSQ